VSQHVSRRLKDIGLKALDRSEIVLELPTEDVLHQLVGIFPRSDASLKKRSRGDR
jgi:hypothetical protein